MKKLPFLLILSLSLVAAAPSARACTALMITDKQGNAYNGRTLEYSSELPFEVVFFPAGTKANSVAPAGQAALSFETQYPVLGVGAATGLKSEMDMLVEATNDQGLSLSVNEFPGCKSPSYPEADTAKYLGANDLGLYMLGNFKTVAEVRRALESADLRIWLPELPIVGNLAAPFHYIFFDKTGAGIVVEYVDGKQNIHDNPVGVATNLPDFAWQLTNLNNYAFLSNVDKNSGQFGKLKVSAPDSGNALDSVPSNQTSPGRFVKAAYYAQYARKADSPEQAIITLAHVMNNFDRVRDISVDEGNFFGDGPSSGSQSSEVTYWTAMNDKTQNLFFLRTIDAMNFSTFDIAKLAPIKSVVKVPLAKINDVTLDGTQLILSAASE
jgi:choloylglycine hydrolase